MASTYANRHLLGGCCLSPHNVRPEKYTDHVGWNAHFELELALKYTRYRYTLPAMGSMKDGEWLARIYHY
jgi:hypothetical protein